MKRIAKISIGLGAAIFALMLAFQNFSSINFENTQELSKGWWTSSNCSLGSSANIQYQTPVYTFEGSYSLRLISKSFAANCQFPGMYALSPAFSVRGGQKIRVGSRIRNATYLGRTTLIFYNETQREVGTQSVSWTRANDWPRWRNQPLLIATAPTNSTSFKVRYELQSANAIVDIDSLPRFQVIN